MYGLRLFTIIIKTAGNKVRLVWIIPLVLMDHHGFFVNHCWFFLRSLCIIVDYFFDCCRTLGVVLGHWRSMWIVVNYFLGNCCQIFCIVADLARITKNCDFEYNIDMILRDLWSNSLELKMNRWQLNKLSRKLKCIT